MYIAALGFEFYNSILTNKIHCTYHEMQAANKTNKMNEVLGGGGGGLNLASLNCAFLPWAKYELQVIFYFEAALLHYIGCFFEESIFLYESEV